MSAPTGIETPNIPTGGPADLTADLSVAALEVAHQVEVDHQAQLQAAEEAAAAETARRAATAPVHATWNPSPTANWWSRLAICETGGDFTMHGSIYSSAYGIANGAIRENAPADVAERILAGTASSAEQLGVAQEVYRRFGPWAWGCTHTIGEP